MSRNTLKFGSGEGVGSASALFVVGTFLIRLPSFATAASLVVKYLISAQAASGFLAFLEMPTMLPVTYPPPYRAGSVVGTGATPYCSLGAWSLRKAMRNSASMLIATLPFWNALSA